MASKSLVSSLNSTIGKKFIAAITGLAITGFVLVHMLGNITYFFGSDAFNTYAYTLFSLGPALYVIEMVLLAAFVFHAYMAISVTMVSRSARSSGYANVRGAGGPSYKTTSSTSMIYTGVLMLIFLVMHLFTFKFGPVYTTNVDGTQMRDLYKLVYETFKGPAYTFGYVIVMLLLGWHLRHGFWSAFQSLGTNHPNYSKQIYSTGVALAVLVTVGFIGVPLYVFFLQQ